MVAFLYITTAYDDSITRGYDSLDLIGKGTFSDVLKARGKVTGKIVAVKRLHRPYDHWRDVREVYAAGVLPEPHQNILHLFEVHYGIASKRISLVYELMDSDLYSLIHGNRKDEPLPPPLPHERVCPIMYQIFAALAFLHRNGLFHCDLKPENVLLKFPNDLVKLGDFGSVLQTCQKLPQTSEYAASRYYRPPECLLTNGYYSLQIDIWAVGCIFYELLTRRVLFRGKDEMDQISIIHNVVGHPPYDIILLYNIWANYERDSHGPSSPLHDRYTRIDTLLKELKAAFTRTGRTLKDGICGPMVMEGLDCLLPKDVNEEAKSLLHRLLQYNHALRPSALAAMKHAYFKTMTIHTQ